jgi:hypothetical protein
MVMVKLKSDESMVTARPKFHGTRTKDGKLLSPFVPCGNKRRKKLTKNDGSLLSNQ